MLLLLLETVPAAWHGALQTAEMKNWLDRAKRTRISGYNRRTKWTVIGGGEEAGA